MEQQNQEQKSDKYILPDGTAGQPGSKRGQKTVISTGKAPDVQDKSPVKQSTGAAPHGDGLVMGGVPVEQEDAPREKQPSTGSGRDGGFTPTRRRRKKPAMATAGQKIALLILGVVFAFTLGILAGVGLSYGSWVSDETLPPVSGEENPGYIPVSTGETTQPEDTEDTEPPQTGETENTDIEDPTETTTDTTDTTEPDTTETTEPVGTESQPTQTEPAQTDPPATEPPATEPKPTDPPATQPPATANPEDYFFHDADSRYLTESDYAGLSDWELVLARNEIFARHGRRFDTPEIQAYFDGCAWYKGTISPEDFDVSVLNAYERENVRILKRASDAR